MPSPLSGLRVLDLSRVAAGPFAGRMMADLGADVVKLEPPEGDVTRVWGEVRHGLSGFYTQHNVGKRNICIDLRAPGGADIALALAAVADVLIENFRPDVLDRLGLGWGTVHAANPRLIMLSISGFGRDGPAASRQAYAPVIHAESGLISRQAFFDEDAPSDPVLSIADYDAGLHGLVGVLAALHMRDSTGLGQRVDIAMIDAMLVTDDYSHHALDESSPVRLGGNVWPAPGRPVMVAGPMQNTWKVLSAAFGIADPTAPGAPLAEKIANRRRALEGWFGGFTDRAELIADLEKLGLAWADVQTAGEAFSSRPGAVAEVDDRGGGLRRVVQSPYRFSDADARVRGGAPHMGEHNEEVLREWLGWDAGRVESVPEGVLRQDLP